MKDVSAMGNKRKLIEGMYQRAMDLRDSTPCPDWSAAEKVEKRYLAAYMKAYKRTQDVATFKKETRGYRRFLRESQGVSPAVVA
jgi:hypothetical protein